MFQLVTLVPFVPFCLAERTVQNSDSSHELAPQINARDQLTPSLRNHWQTLQETAAACPVDMEVGETDGSVVDKDLEEDGEHFKRWWRTRFALGIAPDVLELGVKHFQLVA